MWALALRAWRYVFLNCMHNVLFYIILVCGAAVGAVCAFYIRRALQTPLLHRAWERHHATLPHVISHTDGTVRIEGVRHARYQSEFDFELAYTTEHYDPKKIVRVWYSICPWGPLDIQAHAWVTFDFLESDGSVRPLVVSVEVRKENAFTFYAYRAVWENYELFYVLADEEDIVALRTHIWKSPAYMYPLALTPQQMRDFFAVTCARVEHFYEHPLWYRITKRQCNSEHVRNMRRAGIALPWWDYRIIVAGHIDRLLFSRGLIDTTRSFADTRAAANILPHVAHVPVDGTFSRAIRAALFHTHS